MDQNMDQNKEELNNNEQAENTDTVNVYAKLTGL